MILKERIHLVVVVQFYLIIKILLMRTRSVSLDWNLTRALNLRKVDIVEDQSLRKSAAVVSMRNSWDQSIWKNMVLNIGKSYLGGSIMTLLKDYLLHNKTQTSNQAGNMIVKASNGGICKRWHYFQILKFIFTEDFTSSIILKFILTLLS